MKDPFGCSLKGNPRSFPKSFRFFSLRTWLANGDATPIRVPAKKRLTYKLYKREFTCYSNVGFWVQPLRTFLAECTCYGSPKCQDMFWFWGLSTGRKHVSDQLFKRRQRCTQRSGFEPSSKTRSTHPATKHRELFLKVASVNSSHQLRNKDESSSGFFGLSFCVYLALVVQ